MRTITTISIDPEVLQVAKARYNNMSQTIQDLLVKDMGITEDNDPEKTKLIKLNKVLSEDLTDLKKRLDKAEKELSINKQKSKPNNSDYVADYAEKHFKL